MWFRLTVFCFVVWCFVLLAETDALKAGDEGVCVVKISSQKTRTKAVGVVLNKWCGKKRCIIRKTRKETYMVTSNQTVCCKGWEYKTDKDTCSPQCSTGCTDGRCVAPEQCQCHPPLYLDPEHKNRCLKPYCESACVNGECVSNNTCSCNEGFVTHNSTHCAPRCDKGFLLSGELKCTPKCNKICVNSSCTSPNICTCNFGYKSKDTFTCEPVCDTNRTNAVCVEPNVWSCKEGYVLVNASNCEPKCDGCQNGYCKLPNKCTCHKGYTLVNGTCQPFCKDTCVNGYCSAPDTCSCNEGFLRNESHPHICEKFECRNCTEHGVCVDERVHGKGCRKKQCMALVCCEKWVYKNGKCIPQCKFGCENGTCVGPDKCECTPPLVLKNKWECAMPKCDPPCVNATCEASGKCSCWKNYYPLNKSHCELCPSGHYIDSETSQCKPKCENPCINGNCTGPNQCTCSPGYKYKDTFECIPECKPSCENGICIAPNICKCPDGYKLEEGYKCTPICDVCKNGNCVAPNTCECHGGYSKKNGTLCTPDCKDCDNGICVGPNYCECSIGYSKKSKSNKCTPDCKNKCINGFCSEPDVCACLEGYTLINSTCVPVCEPTCENASCIMPNKCQCLQGYLPSPVSDFRCQPKCDSCQHGKCVAPNDCSCDLGYDMANGTCYPVCSRSCVNGYCSSPENCTCNTGFTKNASEPHICFKTCEIPCENGKCNLNGVCICDDEYEFKNGSCVAMPIENCNECKGSCKGAELCRCPDKRPCAFPVTSDSEVGERVWLAGLQITWLVAGAVCLLLVTLFLVVLRQMWNKRTYKTNQNYENENNFNGSVVFTMPNTLLNHDIIHERVSLEENDYDEVTENMDEEEKAIHNNSLLRPGTHVRRDP